MKRKGVTVLAGLLALLGAYTATLLREGNDYDMVNPPSYPALSDTINLQDYARSLYEEGKHLEEEAMMFSEFAEDALAGPEHWKRPAELLRNALENYNKVLEGAPGSEYALLAKDAICGLYLNPVLQEAGLYNSVAWPNDTIVVGKRTVVIDKVDRTSDHMVWYRLFDENGNEVKLSPLNPFRKGGKINTSAKRYTAGELAGICGGD
jgi:hypothetical protein